MIVKSFLEPDAHVQSDRCPTCHARAAARDLVVKPEDRNPMLVDPHCATCGGTGLIPNGRQWVREHHIDHAGADHYRDYLALPEHDRDAILSARAVALNEELQSHEFRQCVTHGVVVTNHNTPEQLAARWRKAYAEFGNFDAAKHAHWMVRAMQRGLLDEKHVQAAYGHDPAKFAATKAKLTALHDHYDAILHAVGE